MSGGGVAGRGGRCRITIGGAAGNAGFRTLKDTFFSSISYIQM